MRLGELLKDTLIIDWDEANQYYKLFKTIYQNISIEIFFQYQKQLLSKCIKILNC
jgi:hypothetical protein